MASSANTSTKPPAQTSQCLNSSFSRLALQLTYFIFFFSSFPHHRRFRFRSLTLSLPQQVDLATVPTPQLTQIKNQLTQELSDLTTSFAQLRAAQTKFRDCIASVRDGVAEKKEGLSTVLDASFFFLEKVFDLIIFILC